MGTTVYPNCPCCGSSSSSSSSSRSCPGVGICTACPAGCYTIHASGSSYPSLNGDFVVAQYTSGPGAPSSSMPPGGCAGFATSACQWFSQGIAPLDGSPYDAYYLLQIVLSGGTYFYIVTLITLHVVSGSCVVRNQNQWVGSTNGCGGVTSTTNTGGGGIAFSGTMPAISITLGP